MCDAPLNGINLSIIIRSCVSAVARESCRSDMHCFPLSLFLSLLFVSISFSYFRREFVATNARSPHCPRAVHSPKGASGSVSFYRRICNEFYKSHVRRFCRAKRNNTSAALTVARKANGRKICFANLGEKWNSLHERERGSFSICRIIINLIRDWYKV